MRAPSSILPLSPLVLALTAGCAWRTAAPASAPVAAALPPVTSTVSAAASSSSTTTLSAFSTSTTASELGSLASLDGLGAEPDDGEIDDDGPIEEEESAAASASGDGLRYTLDISDEELAKRWKENPASLGPISIGFAHEGRLINAHQFPRGDGRAWTVVSPEGAWTTRETIDYVIAAVERVKTLHPRAHPLRVNDISLRDGGWFRPHRSHQNGRDVDLAFYYATPDPQRVRAREKVIDVELTWELVKSLVMVTDVQIILVDRRVQKVLYDFALSRGEDKAWLDSIFHGGNESLIQHARRHRDHFHVRFFNGRAQELGRRVAPLLADRPDQNIVFRRVKRGDTLGALARKYRSSVKAIQKANHMKGSFLRLSQVLKIPMRGPCTQCPVPPPVFVPPRRMPPETMPASVATSPAPAAAETHAAAAAAALLATPAPPIEGPPAPSATPEAGALVEPAASAEPPAPVLAPELPPIAPPATVTGTVAQGSGSASGS